MNSGMSATSYSKVNSYNGSARSHTLTADGDGLLAGISYKFKLLARNSYGVSDYSEELDAVIASFPLPNGSLRKVSATETSIQLAWDASADT